MIIVIRRCFNFIPFFWRVISFEPGKDKLNPYILILDRKLDGQNIIMRDRIHDLNNNRKTNNSIIITAITTKATNGGIGGARKK